MRDPYNTHGNMRLEDRCVVFLHIPKTAGRTLSSSLVRNFPPRDTIHLDILDSKLDDEMERIPLESRSRARLLWGHVPYGVHTHMPRSCEYVTVLREPVARVVSVYKYILRTPRHVLHDRVVSRGVGLEEYIESGMDEGQTENSQTRQLSGRQFGVVDEEALAEAKRNLQGFLVVGLTERFEESFALLRRALRLRIPFYVTRNESPPFRASDSALKLVRERTELDRELYAFARDLFLDQVSNQGTSFRLEVSAFRALRPVSRAGGGWAEQLLRRVSDTRLVRRLVG